MNNPGLYGLFREGKYEESWIIRLAYFFQLLDR